MARGNDTIHNTAAAITLDQRTGIREVTAIIRHRAKVQAIRQYGQIVEDGLRGWDYTHCVCVPPGTERIVGYPIEGHYHINMV